MEQMKREQLLFSAGELLERKAEWCSGGCPPKAQTEWQEAAPMCAYVQTSGLASLWKESSSSLPPPTAGNQTPWRQRTVFPSQQALLWIVTLPTALDPLLLWKLCGECERGTWSRGGEMEHGQGCRHWRRRVTDPLGTSCGWVRFVCMLKGKDI